MSTTHTYKDIAATAVGSAYKWLTSTLLAAQQGFAVRPYFTCQIIDETIQPNAQLFSGGGFPLSNGSMALAPDGTAYAVGLDGSNALAVWSDTNLNAVGGVWRNKVTLNTSGDGVIADSRNVFSISISEPYLGKYRISVWYFSNFANDGTNLKIKLQYSDDGGASWSEVNLAPGSIPNNSLGNVSLSAMKPVFSGGVMNMGCFYIKKNSGSFGSGFTGYDVYYIYGDAGGGFSTDVVWGQNVNSFDWTIHSLGAFYLKGVQYLSFSGFRNIVDSPGQNLNYSIWVTSLLNLSRTAAADLWSAPVSVMPVGSASPINQNSFTLPMGSVFNDMVYLTTQATIVESLSQTSQGASATIIQTHTNYILLQSDDGQGFSYPSVFVGTDGSEFTSATPASFILQNGYWYLGGAAGWLWQYVQNNVIADVSADVIGYQLQEAAGQPSSIQVQIANANNKWVGASPTGPGASAIARNRKIALWQGYYNSSVNPEAVPHSVYFIDDIQQSITSTQNDVVLVGRDLYKKLRTTITKFSYQFVGPFLFTDIFDGTFASSWNQISGVWTFISAGGATPPPLVEITSPSGSDDRMVLVSSNLASYGHLMRVFFRNQDGGTTASKVHIYALYIDSTNWLRLEINTHNGQAWAVVQSINGSTSTLDSGNLPFTLNSSGSHYYGIYIRRYDYFKFNFMIDDPGGVGVGNSLNDYNPSLTSFVFFNTGTGEYDLTGTISSNHQLQAPFTVGIGSAGGGPRDFRFFSLATLTSPSTLGNVMHRLARIAGVFSFKITYAWRELLFANNFVGTFTLRNRSLIIAAGNSTVSSINTFSNGEIRFRAKVAVTNNSNPAGLKFIFRADSTSPSDAYYFHVIQASTGFANPPVFCRFERLYSGTGITYFFYNTPYDVSNNPQTLGSLNIDITKYHNYRIEMIDGWFYAFIDDVMVAAFNDNNTSTNYLTSGKWGFSADTNSTVTVKDILAPNFWKPVPAFSFNPGDDAESAVVSLLGSLRSWVFSDLLGRFKAIFLSSSDPSTYTYDSQLFQQRVDTSDKEYVAQVTVNGNGVSATARNTVLLTGVPTRDKVIVDFTITTQQDAQTRANNELINANQYINQYTPKQIVNVGAELFDAVTIVNTGNNTSGVSGPTRTYSQTFVEGGGNNNSDYSLEIDTGTL